MVGAITAQQHLHMHLLLHSSSTIPSSSTCAATSVPLLNCLSPHHLSSTASYSYNRDRNIRNSGGRGAFTSKALPSSKKSTSGYTMENLTNWLLKQEQQGNIDAELTIVLSSISLACKQIASLLQRASISKLFGSHGTINIQGEDQRKLDVISNEVFCNCLRSSGRTGIIASEEEEVPIVVEETYSGNYTVVFDPIDGSANIDTALTTGSIFGIYSSNDQCLVNIDDDTTVISNSIYILTFPPVKLGVSSNETLLSNSFTQLITHTIALVWNPSPSGQGLQYSIQICFTFLGTKSYHLVKFQTTLANCNIMQLLSQVEQKCITGVCQPGNNLLAAGYCLYSSSIVFVISIGNGVFSFTLDPMYGEFILTQENIQIPKSGKIYSFNEANYQLWDVNLKKYIDHFKDTDAHGKRYSARYLGCLVGEIHRTLLYGGIYGNPSNTKSKKGNLRLLYECAPMSYLVEQAGGKGSDGHQRILDITPEEIHQRVPLFIGSPEDVDKLEMYLAS